MAARLKPQLRAMQSKRKQGDPGGSRFLDVNIFDFTKEAMIAAWATDAVLVSGLLLVLATCSQRVSSRAYHTERGKLDQRDGQRVPL